jgi:uncharacterized protein DUF5989
MKAARNVAGGASTIRELFAFLLARKLFWLIPFVATLLLMAMLLLVGEASGIGPFIYTLF